MTAWPWGRYRDWVLTGVTICKLVINCDQSTICFYETFYTHRPRIKCKSGRWSYDLKRALYKRTTITTSTFISSTEKLIWAKLWHSSKTPFILDLTAFEAVSCMDGCQLITLSLARSSELKWARTCVPTKHYYKYVCECQCKIVVSGASLVISCY